MNFGCKKFFLIRFIFYCGGNNFLNLFFVKKDKVSKRL